LETKKAQTASEPVLGHEPPIERSEFALQASGRWKYFRHLLGYP